jgi:radical SAM superfamily enzyme YgiQ (UPF0313 family)
MQKMREAGLCIITCGFETGCQDVLDFYSKGTTVEQNREVIRLADRHGIYTFANFMLGAPIETREHFRETIEFAMTSPLDAAKFGVLWYIHGSRLWDEAHEAGLIRADELYVMASKERMLSPLTQRELEEMCFKATRGFYARATYWMRQVRKAIRVGRQDTYLVRALVGGLLEMLGDRLQTKLLGSFRELRRSLWRKARILSSFIGRVLA